MVTTYRPPHVRHTAKRTYKPPRTEQANQDKRFYNSSAWQRLRKAVLMDEPLCVACEREGALTPATEVDHIISRRKAPERELDVDNLQPLCKSCHTKKTNREDRRRERAGGTANVALPQ